MRHREFSQEVATWCFLAFVAIVAVCAMCQCSSATCARAGALEAEYWAALDKACGNLTAAQCESAHPGAVKSVDAEFQPKFEEASRCPGQ